MIFLVKLPFRVGGLLGWRRLLVFGLGVAVGLLLAPTTGAAMRERMRALVEGDLPNDPVPAEGPWGARESVVDPGRETT